MDKVQFGGICLCLAPDTTITLYFTIEPFYSTSPHHYTLLLYPLRWTLLQGTDKLPLAPLDLNQTQSIWWEIQFRQCYSHLAQELILNLFKVNS